MILCKKLDQIALAIAAKIPALRVLTNKYRLARCARNDGLQRIARPERERTNDN